MKHYSTLTTIWLAAVLLALAPARVQAQPTTLNFTLTATYQQPDTMNTAGTTTTSTTKSVKWTPSSILALLTNSEGAAFPKGAYLAQDSGTIEVLGSGGYSTNVDSIVTFDTAGTEVYTGSVNSTTSQQSDVYTIYVTATFNDGNGNTFSVDGLLRETVSSAAQDANGDPQTETISFSGTVAGYGSVLDKNGNIDTAVFSGSISGSGKGPQGS
jgi:hypothetical protein